MDDFLESNADGKWDFCKKKTNENEMSTEVSIEKKIRKLIHWDFIRKSVWINFLSTINGKTNTVRVVSKFLGERKEK